MRIGGVVVAAGRGERFGQPKATLEVGGVEMWRRAVDLLEGAGCEQVVVVGPVPGGVPGGERRRDSVAAGLAALDPGVEFVLVHDAVRPLAGAAIAKRVVDRLAAGGADAVVPVVPVRDTIKRVDGERVVGTIDRSGLVAVQTPQGFRAELLAAVQQADGDDATDEAALVERNGGRVETVDGDPANLKVTYPADLAVAEALL